MEQPFAVLSSPALAIALGIAAVWIATGGFWPTPIRPRPASALASSAVIAFAVVVLVQNVIGPQAA